MEKVKRMGMDAEPLWGTYMNQKAAALGMEMRCYPVGSGPIVLVEKNGIVWELVRE